MSASKRTVSPIELAQLACAVALAVGVVTFARACDAHDDGTFMSCHWAGQAVLGVAVVLVAICVARQLAPNSGVRLGLSVATVPLGVLVAAIPGGLISLCIMDTMRCHAVMRPTAVVLGVAICALGALDAFRLYRAVGEGA